MADFGPIYMQRVIQNKLIQFSSIFGSKNIIQEWKEEKIAYAQLMLIFDSSRSTPDGFSLRCDTCIYNRRSLQEGEN